jgi:hypothetical protein
MYMRQFITILTVMAVLIGGFSTSLYAQSTMTVEGGAGLEDVLVYENVDSPMRFPFYARPGTVIKLADDRASSGLGLGEVPVCNRTDMTCNEGQNSSDNWPRATIECMSDGHWALTASSGSCYLPPFGCCYRNVRGGVYVDHGCRLIPVGTDIKISETSSTLDALNCRSVDNLATPAEKQYCVFNYEGYSGITGNTGDDMFSIDPQAGAFFVYKHESSTAKYISRSGGGRSQKIMMPSGPGGTFADYKRFINNPPAFVNVENACPPVEVNLCNSLGGSMPPPPAVDAQCGLADSRWWETADNPGENPDRYKEYADIPVDDRCAFGDAFFVSDGDTITWDCNPPEMLPGGESDRCSVAKCEDRDFSQLHDSLSRVAVAPSNMRWDTTDSFGNTWTFESIGNVMGLCDTGCGQFKVTRNGDVLGTVTSKYLSHHTDSGGTPIRWEYGLAVEIDHETGEFVDMQGFQDHSTNNTRFTIRRDLSYSIRNQSSDVGTSAHEGYVYGRDVCE